jgi:hypothetical protein
MLSLAACAGEADDRDGGVAVWQVDTAAVLEIGEVEGDSAYQLYRSCARSADRAKVRASS